MKPLVTFGDAAAAVIDVLRQRLADRGEDYTQGVTVSAHPPRDFRPDIKQIPFLFVRVDATERVLYPVTMRCLIALTVWHRDAESAHDLAALAQSLLARHSGGLLRVVHPLDGPIPVIDKRTRHRMATCTVAATLRPVTLPEGW